MEQYFSTYTSRHCEEHYFVYYNDYEVCEGIIRTACPPAVVSSLDEVNHYCPTGNSQRNNQYQCDDSHGDVLCQGTIDSRIVPPLCSRNISSCEDEEYYSVCDKPTHGYVSKHCGKHHHDHDGEHNQFSCWDKQQEQWCRGFVITATCPNQPIASCGELHTYGFRPSECVCQRIEGTGSFDCYHREDDEPWCRGRIEPATTISQPAPSTKVAETPNTASGRPSTVSIKVLIGCLVGLSVLGVTAILIVSKIGRQRRQGFSLVPSSPSQNDEDYNSDIELNSRYRLRS